MTVGNFNMEKTLNRNDSTISYVLKNRKGIRSIRISVNGDGSVVVTKNSRLPIIFAEAFVKSKFTWIQEQLREVEKRPKKLLAHYNSKDFKAYKERSLVLVHDRVAYFNKFYNFEIKNITVRNQKTRWGSCSGKKNLSFNYKILFLPEELQDYIVVHELCHLKEMNHSKKFWNLVATQVPDYKIKRQKIKLY